MRKRKISATEAARHFADVIGQVRYQATRFEVVKGKEVVAQIIPAGAVSAGSLQAQMAQLAAGAHLAAEDVASYAADVEATSPTLKIGPSEWD
ncbi:MAG: hypothetical protein VKP62_10350 [Candidatus Sericytochromatia bacterium]|nr:hypothetical protein [Candidatus Sericytochromatia bacterium]